MSFERPDLACLGVHRNNTPKIKQASNSNRASYHRTPMSPYTLASDRYKTNINRNKTRKWVEAKKVDYGGDDWGAEDDFEDDDAGDSGSATEATPPMPLPQATRPGRLAGLRSIGQDSGASTPRSGSVGSARSLRPSERIALERQTSGGLGQRSVTGPPALQIQTGVQPQRSVQPAESAVSTTSLSAAQPQFPARKSSMADSERPNLTIDAATHPPRTSSRSVSPGNGSAVRSPVSGAGLAGPPKIVRPSEIYRRMEEKEGESKSIDSARRPSWESSGAAVNSQRSPSFGRSDSGDGNHPLQQPLASVAERKSEYDLDGPGAPSSRVLAGETSKAIETRPEPEASTSARPTPPVLQHPPATDEAALQQPPKRFSTSPKLPDLDLVSGFGSDFFSNGGGFMGGSLEAPAEVAPAPATRLRLESTPAGTTHAAEPTSHDVEANSTAAPTQQRTAEQFISHQIPEPSQPKPVRPAIPGGWVSETTSVGSEHPTPFSEQDKSSSGLAINNMDMPAISERPEDLALKPAPLRTPTPRSSSPTKSDGGRGPSRASHASSSDALPRLRTSQSPLANVEQGKSEDDGESTKATPIAPAPLQPHKGASSEELSEEPNHPVMRVDTGTTADNSSPLKESDVLRDEIMRSLSPVRGSDAHLDTLKDESATRESAYLDDVYGDYWTPQDSTRNVQERRGLEAAKLESGSASVTPTTTAAIPPSGDKPVVPAAEPETEPAKPAFKRERFSWEAASENSKPSAASPTKHPLPELPKDAFSSPPDIPQLSPIDSGPTSPLIPLPVLDFVRSDGETVPREGSGASHRVSSVGSIPPGQDPTTKDPHSPASRTGDRGSMLFSPSDEKIAVMSPTSPMSPMTEIEPIQLRPDSAASQEDATPHDIPLPRSPSPTKPAGDSSKPPSSEQNIMNLKQIMALPTSPERVYKMLEARAEFASMPSGLPQWLTQLLGQPEHANAGPSFKYAPAGDDVPLFANSKSRPGAVGGAADGTGPQRPHSGSVTLGSGGGGSVRIPGASAAQLQLGNLMHGQAGVKGKEFLQTAGKMGKGLLSKGKNKLRERKAQGQ